MSEPVRRVTVRLPPRIHAVCSDAARREGISLAEYVREATLMRAAWEAGVAQGRSPRSALAIIDGIRALRRELEED